MTGPAKYRKKPVVIESMQFVLGETTKGEILAFCPTANVGVAWRSDGIVNLWPTNDDGLTDIRWVSIPTLEGAMSVSDGDFIIRGVQGEFYPCKPDIFAATYEAVTA